MVTRLLDKHYTTRPDGIPGNDDTGTMSAWAVFSMMGFYPDCPGHPSYTLTTPRFDRIELADGTVITRKGNGRIKTITLSGKRYNNYRISHKELKGSTLNIRCAN